MGRQINYLEWIIGRLHVLKNPGAENILAQGIRRNIFYHSVKTFFLILLIISGNFGCAKVMKESYWLNFRI
jgi:hypothetical protein